MYSSVFEFDEGIVNYIMDFNNVLDSCGFISYLIYGSTFVFNSQLEEGKWNNKELQIMF